MLSFASGQGQGASCCVHGNEPSFTVGNFSEIRNDCAAWLQNVAFLYEG